MKKGMIGKKLGMTQVYNEAGDLVPVTAIELGPCTVVDVRTVAKNGYSALQLGFGTRKAKNVSKAVIGNLKKAKLEEVPPAVIHEVRLDSDSDLEPGAVLKADVFSANEFVDITGRTKGRGFAGVVRRYNFNGGRAAHGGGWIRRTGSIGKCEAPGSVRKGKKLPGHMGNVFRTVENLTVVEVRPEMNLMLVKGAIPGSIGGYVLVKNAVKK